MNNVGYIDYVEEQIEKVIATSVYPSTFDGLNREEITAKIFEMLEEQGYDLGDESELRVDYTIDKNFGNTPFVVNRVIDVKIPYKVELEGVYSSYFQEADYNSMNDVQKESIPLQMMKDSGIDIDDDCKIIYGKMQVKDGANMIPFTVCREKRERISEEEAQNFTLKEDSVKSLEGVIKEYKTLKSMLDHLDYRYLEDKKVFGYLEELITVLNESSLYAVEMDDDLKQQLENTNYEIENLVIDLEEYDERYEEIFGKMQQLVDSENLELEKLDLLSDEELISFREAYTKKKLIESERAQLLKNKIDAAKSKLATLTEIKKEIENNILKAEELGITVREVKEIENVLQKKKILEAILEKKNISSDLDDKEIKTEVAKEIVDLKNKSGMSILDAIEALYNIDSETILEEMAREVEMSEEDLNSIKNATLSLPTMIVNREPMQNYIPGEAPSDMVDAIKAAGNTSDDTLEKVIIYYDSNNDLKKYVNESTFLGLNLPLREEVKIDGVSFYEISDDDLEFIFENANNIYSPYTIEEREINLGTDNNLENQNIPSVVFYPENNRDLEEQNNQENAIDKINYSMQDNREKIVIYVDLDNDNKVYAKKYLFNRFNLEISGEETFINKVKCFELGEDDLDFIIGNANNDYSPYEVVFENVHLGKIDENEDEHEDENEQENENNHEEENAGEDTPSEEINEEYITLYRDLNDNNQIYASFAVLNKFEITPSGNSVVIDGRSCYKISNDADRLINYIAKNSTNPKISVNYIDVRIAKKEKPHVETILDKLTVDLNIKAKDCKRFQASNIKVADSFKKELKSGNFLYNVFHFVPAVIKLPFMLAKKLVGKLMTTARAKKSMNELQRRLDEDLTEEELEVLFDEYKGSQLKTDMNNQINGLIGQRLTRYGLEKVADLNENIKDSYANLFALLGQVKVIEQQLTNDELSEDIAYGLMEQRKQLIDRASEFVKSILVSRKDANNLLSSGVHGIEEDFKAVSSKLSYVGMRFAKINDFDNELQHQLGEYGKGLNEALSTGNNEEVVSNFMGLESCYFENTKVAKSLKGKRSVGAKYYSPLAEQFDYRDDPFIRDLFTTLAVTSAAVSAVNSVRVHQIESNRVLNQHQQDVDNINASNDSIMDYVHQSAKDIRGRRDTFKEGMEAQAHKDVLSSANTIERSELDMHNWSFSDAYHAADAEGHAFFNKFNNDVTAQINDIASKYGSGSINSVEALQLMNDVSSKAHATLTNVSTECLDILKNYAASHPQFDLSAIQESMEYIVQHPDAIVNMNQGMIDVTNIAGGLTKLEAAHLTALSSLPSDMLSTLVCAASATGLALNVSRTMNNKYSKKNGYGNEVTEMMREYLGVENVDNTFNEDEFDENFDEDFEDDFDFEDIEDEEVRGRHR